MISKQKKSQSNFMPNSKTMSKYDTVLTQIPHCKDIHNVSCVSECLFMKQIVE